MPEALPTAYKLDESRWPLVVITPTEAVKDAAARDVSYATRKAARG